MASDKTFSHESLQDMHTVLRYLDAIKDGFESGRLVLSAGSKELELAPKGLVKLEIDARCKDERNKLILKLSWKDAGATEDDAEPLTIRSE